MGIGLTAQNFKANRLPGTSSLRQKFYVITFVTRANIDLCVFLTMITTLISKLGWDKGSYGYHGDDGNSFCSSGNGQPYGPTFTTNDIIGCGVNLVDNTCFYTKNGHHLGIAFRDLPVRKVVGPSEMCEQTLVLTKISFFSGFADQTLSDRWTSNTRRNCRR